MGFHRDEMSKGTADVLLGFRGLEEVIQRTWYEGLQLVPSSRPLLGVTVELWDLPRREQRLHQALNRLGHPYRYVLLDCPASLGLLTINALAACHSVILPMRAGPGAGDQVQPLLDAIETTRRDLNPRLDIEGVLLTMGEHDHPASVQAEHQAREAFGAEVFDTVVPRSQRFPEAQSYGRPVIDFDPNCQGALAYRSLAQELVERHQARRLPATFRVA